MAVTKITGLDVYDNMRKISEMKAEIGRYFHFDCKLWKAIWNHIGGSKDCVIIEREGYVPSHRGTGWGVRLRDWHRYGLQYEKNELTAKEPDVFHMLIVVEYNNEEENNEWEKQYHVNVPVDLLVNFSTAKFKNWISDLRRKRDDLRLTKDLDKLRKLIESYPAEAKEMLQKW